MPEQSATSRTFVDRGGTFTDILIADARGGVTARKVRSDTAIVGNLAEGELTFGTTVATNAILERNVVPSLLIVDEGFADLAIIGDMTRPELFDPDVGWPDPLCARIIEVSSHVNPEELRAATEGMQAVGVALVGSSTDPTRENAVAAALPAHLPVSVGHRLSPELGLLCRVDTVILDASVSPVLLAAIRKDLIPDNARAIRSDGSTCSAADLRAPDAILSGPAGGVLAVAEIVRIAGVQGAAGLDMGGTSTDVCLVQAGEIRRRRGEWRAGGLRLRRPALEIETIAAGGGSILGFDGVGYTVGPASAGANPGPQVFGRGGPPTLTDAGVAAGLVAADSFEVPIDPGLVDLPGPADAFIEIAREAMAAAVRRLCLARGQALNGWALVAFGGAAGQHACAVAERLGLDTVLVHAFASVLSAWGQALAVAEQEVTRPVRVGPGEPWDALAGELQRARGDLEIDGEDRDTIGIQYAGTDTPLEVPWSAPERARAAHAALHRVEFGFDRPELLVEVVWVRVRRRARTKPNPLAAELPSHVPQTTVGPAQIRLFGTTLVVPSGWKADREGALLRVVRTRRASVGAGLREPALDLAIWGARFAGVAADGGEVLRRLARSVSIRERLDFSCAVFDEMGMLIANAPHVPVHLGAMGETVRDILHNEPGLCDGDAWLTNDPAAGGSHLPDLTVVTGVQVEHRMFFVASRAHHVDIGGLTPGSMPPNSRTLGEEGMVFRRWPLVRGGEFSLPNLSESRAPETVRADLLAQLAANRHAAVALRALGGADTLARWMEALTRAVALASERTVAGWAGSATDDVAGIPIRVKLSSKKIDFFGTGGPHPGNLNAPIGVVRAAVLYAVRVFARQGFPLNEGVFQAVALSVPSPCILSPEPSSAVVGGNVETSQRLVDVLFAAAGHRAASAGSMSNLTIGNERWAFYETIGGGLGAREGQTGRSAVQLHMTNTRATDPEVLAARLPITVVRFAVRVGSGGAGTWRGGDGILRELEVAERCSAALLAAWRPEGAPGAADGLPGEPGRAQVRISGVWQPWTGESVGLRPGDRVRVETPGGGGWGTPGG